MIANEFLTKEQAVEYFNKVKNNPKSVAFCRLFWEGLHTSRRKDDTLHNYDVDHSVMSFLPCCIHQSSTIQRENDESINDLINHKLYCDGRRSILVNNELPPQCYKCIDNEKKGDSFRLSKLNSVSLTQDEFVDVVCSTSLLTGRLVDGAFKYRFIELQFDTNKCNMLCRICGPKASSRINVENKKINFRESRIASLVIHKEPYDILKDRKEAFYDDVLVQRSTELKQIHLTGGEPLLSPKTWDLIRNIKNLTSLENLIITTNGSITDTRYGNIFELLSCMPDKVKTSISISIDAINEIAEYARHGVKWSIIDANIKKYLEKAKETQKFNVSFSITMSIFSIYYIHDVMQYFDNLGKEFDINVMCAINFVSGQGGDYRILPVAVRKKLIELVNCADNEIVKKPGSKVKVRGFPAVEASLSHTLPNILRRRADFLTEVRLRDEQRDQNFFDLYPDWVVDSILDSRFLVDDTY